MRSTGATSFVRSRAARWSTPPHERPDQGLRNDLGGPVDSPARGSGAGDRAGPFHRRSAGGALGSLRAKPGRVRPDRTHRRAARCQRDHRRRSSRRSSRSSRCCTSSTTFRWRSRSWPRTWCALSAKLVAAVVAPSKEEAEDLADRVEVEIAPLAAVIDARARPGRRRAGRPSRSAGQRHRRRTGQDAGFRCDAGVGAYADQRSRRARAGRTPRRWRRAPGTPPTTRQPAASR